MPGPGVGGHCIAVDPWFIVEKHPELARIMNAARQTNDGMPHHVLKRVKNIAPSKGKVVLLGITYKPDVDDMRESPIVELNELLLNEGFDVHIHDPFITEYNHDVYEIMKNASLVILAVNHKVYADINFDKMYDVVAKPVVLDTRNFWTEKLENDKRFVNYVLGSGK
jgi:UDP-N-acetyl-D-mannosaminuronic acid dehydrogenase